MSRLIAFGLLGALMFVFGCGSGSNSTSPTVGGGSGGSSAQNSVTITVDGGPAGIGGLYPDAAFATVTLCVPGTSNCQNIDHVLIDTGSVGLRILKSGSTALTLPLAQVGNLAECYQFVASFTWGPVMMADVKMAGEVASNIPIQVIGDSTTNAGFPAVPTTCQNSVVSCPGGQCSADTLQNLGANGLLGVGSFVQDCGSACASSANVGLYYSCPTGSSCVETTASLNQQVPNPVAEFASDNNGVMIDLPAIASASGQATAVGTMFFGIGTQSNNALGNATIFQLDQFGDFTTVYKGQSYPGSFLDSGSNGIFFLTDAITLMSDANCGGTSGVWYCPASTTNFSTSTQGTTGSETVAFNAANANQLFSGSNTAFSDLTGPNSTCFVNLTTTAPCFDWGLPFFFGRRVFTAINGLNTPAGVGPYWAY